MVFISSKNSLASFAKASLSFVDIFPFADKLGWFGQLFFSYGFLVYLAIAVSVVTSIVLKKNLTERMRANIKNTRSRRVSDT